MGKNEHLETIKKVKEFIDRKDYAGLKNYIETRESEVLQENDDIVSTYIDELAKNLK